MAVTEIWLLGPVSTLSGTKTSQNGTKGTMKQKQTRDLFGYWQELFAEFGIPERSQIEPSALRRILGDTFILEHNGNNQLTYRLAGTRLCAAFAIELKGSNFIAPWQSNEQKTITNVLNSVGGDDVVAVFGSLAGTEKGRTVSMETLVMPLLHNKKKHQRILGITTPLTRPYWLGADPVVSQSITGLRIIDPEQNMNHFKSRIMIKGEKPPVAAIKHHDGKRVKHLTVMEGGKSDVSPGPHF